MAWHHPHEDEHEETPLFTYAMLAAFLAVFAAQMTRADLTILHMYPWRLGAGETWRLVTATAMHGGILHFAFNLYWFFKFSTAIERWLGPWVAMGLYVAAAAVGGAAQAIESGGLAVGASGANYGLFGFLWVTRRRYDAAAEAVTPHVIQFMLGWAVICLVINAFGGNIANSAHFAGLALGWGVGQAVVATRRARWPIALGLLVASAGIVAMTWRPVFERTLAKVPVIGARYAAQMAVPPEQWQEREQWQAERQRSPGIL